MAEDSLGSFFTIRAKKLLLSRLLLRRALRLVVVNFNLFCTVDIQSAIAKQLILKVLCVTTGHRAQ
jgi:hypothetical protein